MGRVVTKSFPSIKRTNKFLFKKIWSIKNFAEILHSQPYHIMATKSDKEKKATGKIISDSNKTSAKKESSKPAKREEDDDDDLDDESEETSPKQKSGKASVSSKKNKEEDDDDDDDVADDKQDDWEKGDEGEEWDPDFAEFDVPKSKGKKAATPAKKGAVEEEDDFKVDDEFKDMFNDSDDFSEEDDDY